MQTPAFSQPGLPAPLLAVIETRACERPPPSQAMSIPPALEGRDLVGLSAAGSKNQGVCPGRDSLGSRDDAHVPLAGKNHRVMTKEIVGNALENAQYWLARKAADRGA